MPSLSRSGSVPADRGAEHAAPGCRRRRRRAASATASASSSSSSMSTPARPRGHQPERGQRRVAAADVGVGVEDAVAGGAGGLVERGAGVGDDDDALGRVDAGVAERRLEGAPLAVGLDRRARLGRDDDDGALERRSMAPRHLAGVGGVEDHEVDAGGARDDLGGERRAAHAAEHDVVDALAARARRAAPRSRRPAAARTRRQLDPAEPLGRLGLGVRAPQRRVLGDEPLANEVASTRLAATPGGDGLGAPRRDACDARASSLSCSALSARARSRS